MRFGRIAAASLLAAIALGFLGVYFDYFGLIGWRPPWLPDWRTVGWEECVDGRQQAIRVCLDRRSGEVVDVGRCPSSGAEIERACEAGEPPPISCCNTAGDCFSIPPDQYREGYSCCGANYGDYGPNGLICCHHGNENARNGCAVTGSNAANTCEALCR